MLLTLASSMAARATWGDETFWASYRRRFDQNLETDWVYWRGYFAALKNQVEMRLLPAGSLPDRPDRARTDRARSSRAVRVTL